MNWVGQVIARKEGTIVDVSFRITNYRFQTRDCFLYVRPGLHQLVICGRGGSSRGHSRTDQVTSFHQSTFRALRLWTTFMRASRVFRSASHGAAYTFAVSAVAPSSKAFAAAVNLKPFVNKDLCTRKSVKPNFKQARAKLLASAWQFKMSGS